MAPTEVKLLNDPLAGAFVRAIRRLAGRGEDGIAGGDVDERALFASKRFGEVLGHEVGALCIRDLFTTSAFILPAFSSD